MFIESDWTYLFIDSIFMTSQRPSVDAKMFFTCHSFMNGFLMFLPPTAFSNGKSALYSQKAAASFFRANFVALNRKLGNPARKRWHNSLILTVPSAICFVVTTCQTKFCHDYVSWRLWWCFRQSSDKDAVMIDWKTYVLPSCHWKDMLCSILLISEFRSCFSIEVVKNQLSYIFPH